MKKGSFAIFMFLRTLQSFPPEIPYTKDINKSHLMLCYLILLTHYAVVAN